MSEINQNIKLIVSITPKSYEMKFLNIYEKHRLSFSLVTYGESGASQSLLSYFGLNETTRSILIGIISQYQEKSILENLNKKIKLNKPGNGIAFTLPISSSNKYIYDKVKISKKEENMMKNITKYHLVITIIQEGYSDAVMNACKKIGAKSGTLIKGRGISNKQFVEFLGITIEPERDIVLVLVEEELKTKLMDAIILEAGLRTSGRGLCFSMPVDNAIGLGDKEI